MNPETLKEYLVKIGWHLDENSFQQVSGKLDNFVEKIKSKSGSIGKGFIGSLSVVLGILKTVNEAMSQVIETTASLDLQEEKLARQYWISEKAARSYSTALEALGEDHADILNMTDEQYRHLVELNNLGKSLETYDELDDFLLLVRDIQFEFSKLKVEISYGTRWVVYFLGKFLGPDAQKVKQSLKSANNWIQKNLPIIAQKVARFFEIFYRLAKAAYYVGKSLFTIIKEIFSLFDNKLGKTAGLVGSFFLLIKSGPIGWFIAALTTLLLLIDDYMTWQRGGASALDWSAFDNDFQNIKEDMLSIKEDLQSVFDLLNDIFGFIDPKTIILETFKNIVSGIRSFTSLIADDLERIEGFIDAIRSGTLFEKLKDFNFGDWLKERTSNLSDFYNNPIVSGVIPGTKDVGLFASLFNKLANWITGSNDGSYTAPQKIPGMPSTNSNNFNGTINFNVKSPQEAQLYYDEFTQRLFQNSPNK